MPCGFDDDEADFGVQLDDAEVHVATPLPASKVDEFDLPPELWTPETSTPTSTSPASSSTCTPVLTPAAADAAGDDSEPLLPAEAKRRRLRQKTPPPPAWSDFEPQLPLSCVPGTPASSCEPTATGVWARRPDDDFDFGKVAGYTCDWPRQEVWIGYCWNRQYGIIFEAVRGFWMKYGAMDSGLVTDKDCYRVVRKAFKLLTTENKALWANRFIVGTSPPTYVARHIVMVFGGQKDKKAALFGKTLMLTFMGHWGLKAPDGDFAETTLTVDQAVEACRQDSALKQLWADADLWCKDMADSLSLADYAVCFEVCTSTLRAQRRSRVHMHFWCRSNRRIYVPQMDALCYQGVRPNIASVINGVVRDTRNGGFTGALYCSHLKVGSIWAFCTREMFSGYLVQPSWLLNLLQQDKITPAVCRAAVLRTCQNVAKYLKDLETLEQERLKEETRAEQHRVMEVLAKRRKPFRVLPVVQQWRRQYDDDAFRYKFLVLEGPSRVGKTQYARSLTPGEPSSVLELNCAGKVPIDLRTYSREHRLIIFDEASAPQIISQKKVFQAGPATIQLGQSSTSIYSYAVYLYRTMLVVCSNDWSFTLQKLPADDRDWIVENSVHVLVTEPLFEA